MEFAGKVAGLSQDYATGTYTISFEVKERNAVLSGYDAIKKEEKLLIKAVKYRKKRSLNANAYAWVLMSQIAEEMGTSKDEVYEEMLRRYGVLYEDEDGYIVITVKASVDMSRIDGHWLFLKGNGSFRSYVMIKGSSKYDTKEMSCFIDGIVSESKELGIETITPAELEEMKKKWNV